MACVVTCRTLHGKEGHETRYSIRSRRAGAKAFPQATRAHRGIENPCHWASAVALRGDDHPLREGHGPENLSLVRTMALAMLKKAEAKCGIKSRRLKAGWDEAFLEPVLRDYLDD